MPGEQSWGDGGSADFSGTEGRVLGQADGVGHMGLPSLGSKALEPPVTEGK